MDCLFCKIIDRKIPSEIVFESENVLGFKDIHPQAPHHYLFIPKEHFDSLADVSDAKVAVLADIYKAINHVAREKGISARGYRTVINVRKEGGQVVDHLHVHLLGGKILGGRLSGE